VRELRNPVGHRSYQNFRRIFLERDDFTCRWKGEKENLQVHHWFGDDSSLDEIMTLCKDCHDNAEYAILALRKGEESIYWCFGCKESRLLVHRIHHSPNNVWICPNCGRGFVDLKKDSEIIRAWDTFPFPDIKDKLMKA